MSLPPSTMRKGRKRPPSRRVLRSAALAIFFLLLSIALLSAIGITTQLLAPMTTDKAAKPILVTIPSGANVRDIGKILARKHLIRHTTGFVWAARWSGIADKMRAGRYELSPAMTPKQMAQKIALGLTASDFVTIPEGYTVAQMAHRLAEHNMADAAAFLALAQTQGRSFDADGFRPPDDNLEGYLYPDTYRIPKGTTERQIITQMLRNFRQRVMMPDGKEIARFPGGLPAVITLASLVEREAEVDSDRPLIAAVYRNRLEQHMRLQCDATVQYALPEHKGRLFDSDLRIDSPYNTYLHAGLPPTPIASPGLPSIEAALHPAHVDYLFYVAGPDGRHHIFSRTLAEHDQAVARVHARLGRT